MLFVAADRLEDLIDLSYRITRLRVGDEVLLVNNAYLATLVADDKAEIATLKDELPLWTLIIGVGGRALLPEERVAAAEKDISAEVAARGLRMLAAVPGLSTARVEAALNGLAGEPHWKLRYKGGVQDIFFHTPLDKAPGYLATMLAAAEAHKYPHGRRGRLSPASAPGSGLPLRVQPPLRSRRSAGDGQAQDALHQGERAVDRAGRLLLPPVRRVGRSRLQPRRPIDRRRCAR